LEHIATKYLTTKITPLADLDPRDDRMSSESEQVLPKNYIRFSTKKAIILLQSISSRIPTLKTEVPMTNKISLIKELGVLTHMPDGNSLTVRGCLIRIHMGLIDYRFSTKSST
jgi:hypothetical protein